jgi:hypothetical protein
MSQPYKCRDCGAAYVPVGKHRPPVPRSSFIMHMSFLDQLDQGLAYSPNVMA